MEREIKLRMLKSLKKEDLLKSSTLIPLGNKKPKKVVLEATYYDTTDFQLLNAGFAYRVRKEGRQWVATLKNEGTYRGGLHERQEWNLKQKNEEPDLEVFKEKGLSKIWKDVNGKNLTPLFTVRTERTIQELTLEDGSQVELALDFGKISCEDREDLLQEVELELISGSTAALLDLAASLATEWQLAPEKRSKYTRGLSLAGVEIPTRNEEPDTPDDGIPAPEGALLVLVSQAGSLLEIVEEGYKSGFDNRKIHDFRVQLRQLRSLLALAQPFCQEEDADEWRKKMKECFWTTGSLREMDVLAELIDVIPDEEMVEGDLAVRVRNRRNELAESWEKEWGQGELTAWFLSFWAFLEKNLSEKDTQKPYWSLENWALQTMNQEVKELWKKRNENKFDDFEWSHDLRIEAKELRYALGALCEYLPIRETAKLQKSLEKFQEILGRMQDSYCSADWMKSLVEKKASPEFYQQVGIIKGWLLRDASRAIVEAEVVWVKVQRLSKKWLKYVEG